MTYHFKRLGQNEANYGLGFSYYVHRVRSQQAWLDGSVISVESDIYKDSAGDLGFAAGAAWQRHIVGPVDLGLRAALVHEDGTTATTGVYAMPALVPFVESTVYGPVRLRVTVVPPAGSITHGFAALQMIVSTEGIWP
jgi:hypothetical protein